MKKITAIILIAFTCAGARAQSLYLQGGVNFANITETNNGGTQDNRTLTTFNVGFMGKHYFLHSPVGIESGLLLTGRGSKAEYDYNATNYVKSKFNPLYIELPVNLLVKFPFGRKENIFLNAGPYIAVGVGGKSKLESRTAGIITESSSDIKFSNDDPFTSEQDNAAYNELKRFDYGFNFGGGLALHHVIFKLNYGLGLVKINSTQSNNSANDKNKYRTLSLSLGIPLRG